MHDIFDNALSQMKHIFSDIDLEGANVIDATAGNGNDTLFLAKAVGATGKVYAFDIQQQAINNTQKLLQQNAITWCQLIHDSHENLDKYKISDVRAVVFNLGFLPGGEHAVITQAHSTVIALQKAVDILAVGGVITMTIYTGHAGGKDEEAAILEYLSGLQQRNYDVLQMSFLNRSKCPPYLIAVRKLREVSS